MGGMSLVLASLLAMGGPVEDIRALVESGRDRAAFEMAEREARGGDGDLLDLLAAFYDEGIYVAQDHGRAAAIYRRAAQAGQPHAQWRLGVMLDKGEGVAENPVEAVEWFRRAAAQRSGSAFASLGVMYANARGVPRDYAQSMLHYRRAAELGSSTGFYGVGVLHALGQGVPLDRIEGGAWLLAALAQQVPPAEGMIRDLELTPAEMRQAIDRANALLAEYGLEERISYEEEEERPVVA